MKRKAVKMTAGLIISGMIALGIYTAVPHRIAKSYTGYIFTEGKQLIKEVEVKLNGKRYKGIIGLDQRRRNQV
ncbi:MAG TPA: hypothetical protein GXX38_04495 [Clostridia bacterium]|nr:hypothetical protein [Clostridia bacterium]